MFDFSSESREPAHVPGRAQESSPPRIHAPILHIPRQSPRSHPSLHSLPPQPYPAAPRRLHVQRTPSARFRRRCPRRRHPPFRKSQGAHHVGRKEGSRCLRHQQPRDRRGGQFRRLGAQQPPELQNSLEKLNFSKVLSCQKQVVAGILYHLVIEVEEGSKPKQYEAKVWVKPGGRALFKHQAV